MNSEKASPSWAGPPPLSSKKRGRESDGAESRGAERGDIHISSPSTSPSDSDSNSGSDSGSYSGGGVSKVKRRRVEKSVDDADSGGEGGKKSHRKRDSKARSKKSKKSKGEKKSKKEKSRKDRERSKKVRRVDSDKDGCNSSSAALSRYEQLRLKLLKESMERERERERAVCDSRPSGIVGRGYGPSDGERRSLVPLSKEEHDRQQSVVREVYDPDTGRTRLVKGDGEILERVVSRADHFKINKLATAGDGRSFIAGLALQRGRRI